MALAKWSLACVICVTVAGLPVKSYAASLKDVIESACTFHPDVFTAQLNLSQANEGVKQAKAIVLPRITSISEVGFSDDAGAGAAIQSSIQNSRSRSTQLTLDQAVYLGGRGRAAIAGAKFQRKAQWYNSERQVLNAQLTAIQAYIELAQAQDVLNVRQEELQSLVKRRDEAQRRFELGGGTKSDIVQAKARIARNEADIISAQNEISQARASLYEASGLLLAGPLSLARVPDVPANLEQALDRARAVNPDIQAALASIDVADQNIKTSQGDRSPEIRLLGDLSVQRDTAFNGFEREDASLRMRLTIPIFAGGALASQETGARLAKNSATYEHHRVFNRVRESVAMAWSQYEASGRLIAINKELVAAAQTAFNAVKKEAEAGFRANQDILNAQQELLEARLALTQAQHNNVLSAYFLLGAVGALDNQLYPKCQKLLPSFDAAPKRKIVKNINSVVPGIKLQIPERKRRRGPRNRR